ncbi:RNA-BINDING PROTEIN RELATED [Salix purpurea]|uniref:RNA-BINDING PROTEIN RELATED n=1 Tax=Salix purpurea TaxID=77065 RepID=A0A9Q0UC85_SALPP|nr:RNA-BINDING PROTEIN RELATED [Salix purpurea]
MGQTTPRMVPPPGPRHAVPQLGFPSPAAPPNALSMNRPTTAPTFTSVPQPQAGPSSAPTPIQSSLGMPLPNSSITPAFGSAPISFPVTTSNFAPVRPPTITNAKVQHSGTADFTFRPHQQQNPAPQIVPSFSSHHANQTGPLLRPRMQTQTPQAPHFHMDVPNSITQPGRHLFPPHVGNQLGQVPFVGT